MKIQQFLDHHGIVATPIAYAIAFDYVARRSPALRKELNQQLMRGGKIDEQTLNRLFEEYFLDDRESGLENQLANIHSLLYRALQGMAEAGKGICEFSDLLQNELEELRSDPSPETLTGIVSRLSSATEKAIESNRRLREQMAQAEEESAQLRRELLKTRQQADTDGLTGLLVRRAFDSALDEHIRPEATDKPRPSLLLLDIDHFKRINDNFGHPLGDEVIRSVAATIRKQVRGTDIAARYGGEEFAVLLPETDLAGALTVASTVHKSIERMVLVRKGTRERLPSITVSVGVASLQPGDSAEDLVARADRCLYAAKRAGRNRVLSESQLEAAHDTA